MTEKLSVSWRKTPLFGETGPPFLFHRFTPAGWDGWKLDGCAGGAGISSKGGVDMTLSEVPETGVCPGCLEISLLMSDSI